MGSSRQSMQAGQHQPDKRSGRMNGQQEQQVPTPNAVQAHGTKQGRRQDRTHTHATPAPPSLTISLCSSTSMRCGTNLCPRSKVQPHPPAEGGRNVSIPPPSAQRTGVPRRKRLPALPQQTSRSRYRTGNIKVTHTLTKHGIQKIVPSGTAALPHARKTKRRQIPSMASGTCGRTTFRKENL